MARGGPFDLRQVRDPDEIGAALTGELVDCWVAVTNAGGAAGFPFPPVTVDDVAPVAERLIADLHPQRSRLIMAMADGVLAGWLNLRHEPNPLVAHWGTVHHLQSHIAFRGRGIGSALMNHVRLIARRELGLEQLHLAVRSAAGLEEFYGRLGWKEVGRWPGALRLGPGDDRDEVLMILAPL